MSPGNSSPSESKIKILVLETDEPHPETRDRKGSFGEIFHTLFNEAGDAHSPPLRVETHMRYVVDDPEKGNHGSVPHFSEIDTSISAIIITGSMYDAHGDIPWVLKLLELLKSLWRERKDMKFSGVCFGHQILSRMLGATVETTRGGKWELAHTEMHLTPTGQKLFKTSQSTLSLHQMHQDQVTSTPSPQTSDLLTENDEEVEVWASTIHTPVQGLYMRERLFTSQGHLGFDEAMVQRQIEMRVDAGGITDTDGEKGKETAHLKHDGIIVAGAILRFFRCEDLHVKQVKGLS